mmetsp:Transcript_28449/g.67732  ORF Transcript_28449/g.67732 Transcript_28449/m.67732 type:complete len:385 (-) Transcript_28449:671-1825(-)
MLILEQRDRPRDCLRVCDGLQAMLCPNAAAQARQQSQGLRSLCGPRGTEDLLGPRHGADDALQWQHALSQELAHRPPVVQVVAGHGCERLKHRQSLPRRAWVLAPAALQAPAERLEAPRRVKLSGHLQPELAPQKHGNEWEHSRDCLRAGFLLVEILEGTADDGLQAARVFQPAQGGAVVKKQLQDNRCRGHRVGILHLEHGHKGLHGACVNHLSMEPLIGGSAPKLRDPVRHSGAVFQALGSVRETAAALLQRRGHGLAAARAAAGSVPLRDALVSLQLQRVRNARARMNVFGDGVLGFERVGPGRAAGGRPAPWPIMLRGGGMRHLLLPDASYSAALGPRPRRQSSTVDGRGVLSSMRGLLHQAGRSSSCAAAGLVRLYVLT